MSALAFTMAILSFFGTVLNGSIHDSRAVRDDVAATQKERCEKTGNCAVYDAYSAKILKVKVVPADTSTTVTPTPTPETVTK